jgi:hypothetical protein
MSRSTPTLFDIAKTKRSELTLRPGRPGARSYHSQRLNVEIELWHDGDEAWKLTLRRLGAPVDVSVIAFCRAAFQVPDEAEERPFNRREVSIKTGYTQFFQGIDLIWREVIVEFRPCSERLSQPLLPPETARSFR